MNALETALRTVLIGCPYLDVAMQRATEVLYHRFAQSLVLARIYVTLPFDMLPAPDQAFVLQFAAEKHHNATLTPTTPVLSLLGTCGVQPEWGERRRSHGHIGIPLSSPAVVEGMPMIARLLADLGVVVDGVDRHDGAIETKTFGTFGGLFYVEDARIATDQHGRTIITAQDFVATYGVKTVLGSGGGVFYTAPLSV